MKSEVDSSTPEEKDPVNTGDVSVGEEQAISTRRRFTRNAVMGSAVVLSLTNRPVWAQECVTPSLSVGFLNSVTHASHDPNGIHQKEYEDTLRLWNEQIAANEANPDSEFDLAIGPDPSDPNNKICLIATPKGS